MANQMKHTSMIHNLARKNILAMKPYQSARLEGGGTKLDIHLDANENPHRLVEGNSNRYGEKQPQELLALMAGLYGVKLSQIIATRGADEAIDLLIRCFCEPHEDSIAVSPPTFSMYEFYANVSGVAVNNYPLHDVLEVDFDALHAGQDKLIFICSPNNPVGNSQSQEDIVKLAKAKIGVALIVVDEAYIEFSQEESYVNLLADNANIVVLRTLSKAYSLAGERCGAAIAGADIIELMLRALSPYPLANAAVEKIIQALKNKNAGANISRILSEKLHMEEHLLVMNCVEKLYPSDANYLLVQFKNAGKVMEALRQAGIKVRDRSSLVADCLRISIGLAEENKRVLDVLSTL